MRGQCASPNSHLPNLVIEELLEPKGQNLEKLLADTNTFVPDHALLAQGLNFFTQTSRGFFNFLFFSSVGQSGHLGWVTPEYVPSPNMIFLEPCRKNKLQLGESVCVCISLSRNVCLEPAWESGVYSGKEQLCTLSLG